MSIIVLSIVSKIHERVMFDQTNSVFLETVYQHYSVFYIFDNLIYIYYIIYLYIYMIDIHDIHISKKVFRAHICRMKG